MLFGQMTRRRHYDGIDTGLHLFAPLDENGRPDGTAEDLAAVEIGDVDGAGASHDPDDGLLETTQQNVATGDVSSADVDRTVGPIGNLIAWNMTSVKTLHREPS